MKLVKTVIKGLDGYKNKTLTIDFIAEKRVYEEEAKNFVVTRLISNIYLLNTITLIGINASGKTTTLNILSEILKVFIDNKSLNQKNKLFQYFDEQLDLENYFFDDKTVYKLVSTIKNNKETQVVEFIEEKLFHKSVTSSVTKKEFLNFDSLEPDIIRTKLDNIFLKDEDSIFSGILNTTKKFPIIQDMTSHTNFNYLAYYSKNMPKSFVNYLDPSIELFELLQKDKNNKNSSMRFKIKFKNNNKKITADLIELSDYLSSGTIKGINILGNLIVTLKSGGYLLIDEIENHLNKNIVINLIDLFTSDLNKNGATLIFTTHYSEILDTIERSDSIYILEKNRDITIDKFSKLAKSKDRIDKKKSDLILSGELNTAPSYVNYRAVKKDLQRVLSRGETNDIG